jgi:hypothetical protein
MNRHANLINDVADGILVLRSRDGVPITDAQAQERARNIVAGLLGNYSVRELPPVPCRPPSRRRKRARS